MSTTIAPFFRPRGIAVVGASRRPGTIGWQIVDNLLRHGFQGAIFPVNPSARVVHSIPAWRSVREIPGEVDLAVVAVPKDSVLDVVEECGVRGIPAVVVISAGFRESGEAGAARERALVTRVRELGMRLVGPNCMGVLNTDPAHAMNATFAPTMPPAGTVSFLSQSGALGVTILDYAAEYGIGIRHFISVGNKPDVSGNDLLEFWEGDPGTRVILMYLETFGNPRHFTRIARRRPQEAHHRGEVGPVGGRGPRRILPHGCPRRKGQRRRGAPGPVRRAPGQLGGRALRSLHGLRKPPPPTGEPGGHRDQRGGPGIILADACEAEGLQVAEFSTETQDRLRRIVPEEASVRNPVDMIASATPEAYRQALEIASRIRGWTPPSPPSFPPWASARPTPPPPSSRPPAPARTDPSWRCSWGREGLPAGRAELRAAGIPAYIFPESATRALGAMNRHARWVERPVQAPARFQVEATAVSGILDQVMAEGRDRLLEPEAYAVLEAYGIPVTPHAFVRSAGEAVSAFEALGGGPVVMKVVSPQIVHKTEVGGVLLDVRDADAVRAGWNQLTTAVAREAPDADLRGLLIAPYRKGSREMILGMTMDRTFGPLLMFGLGGIYVETFRDVAFRVPPVTELEAHEMMREIRSFPLLEGVRGEPPVPLDSVASAIQRLSQLVLDHDRITALDINPFQATSEGVVALDARIQLREEVR
jgi:acetate---CoA ligase (ADP-forming)